MAVDSLIPLYIFIGIFIILVIALPVANGVGSYKTNPNVLRAASKELEELEKRRKDNIASMAREKAKSSSASTGHTTSSTYSRRGPKSDLPYSNDNPYAASENVVDDEEEASEGYKPFDYDSAPAPATKSTDSDKSTFDKLKDSVMTKHNPIKLVPATGPTKVKNANLGDQKPVDASQPFSTNIDNEFDYDSFIEEQEKEDAAAALAEARDIELSNRKHEAESEVRNRLASKHMDSLA